MSKIRIQKKMGILIICFLGAIAIIVAYLKFRSNTLSIKASDVKSIQVNMEGPVTRSYYCENTHFTLLEESNINYILDTIKASEDKNYSEYEMSSVEYEIAITLKDGSTKAYSIRGFSLGSNNHMNEVLASKEVVTQIRTAFTIDKTKISKVEYYYWENRDSETANTVEIKDSEMVEKILQVAKNDVLANASKSTKHTKSGFEFTDSSRNVLLVVNISSDMEGYEELLKMIPAIAEHVQ